MGLSWLRLPVPWRAGTPQVGDLLVGFRYITRYMGRLLRFTL